MDEIALLVLQGCRTQFHETPIVIGLAGIALQRKTGLRYSAARHVAASVGYELSGYLQERVAILEEWMVERSRAEVHDVLSRMKK